MARTPSVAPARASTSSSVRSASSDPVQATATIARSTTPESTLCRIDAVLACRTAVDASVAPLLAVEALALALRTG